MKIDKKTGWLENVRSVKSPYKVKRKDPNNVDLLVIHCISLPAGEFGNSNIDDLFLGKLDIKQHSDYAQFEGQTLSSHVLIDRKGELTQYVSFYDQAWHAGISEFQGRSQCNEYSIGIELEGCDEIPYEAEQYEALIKLTKKIMVLFPRITLERIVGHCDIAPGRKTDPGKAFDWELLRWNLLQF